MMTYCGENCCKECDRLLECGGCELCQGHPFGGSCVAERNKDYPFLKSRLIDEINALGILNPAAIVLGGGVMEQKSLFDRVRELYPSYVKPVLAENTAVLPARYGNEAGMIGAFYHFMSKHC